MAAATARAIAVITAHSSPPLLRMILFGFKDSKPGCVGQRLHQLICPKVCFCGHRSRRLVALAQHEVGIALTQNSLAQALVTFGRLLVPRPGKPRTWESAQKIENIQRWSGEGASLSRPASKKPGARMGLHQFKKRGLGGAQDSSETFAPKRQFSPSPNDYWDFLCRVISEVNPRPTRSFAPAARQLSVICTDLTSRKTGGV